MTTKKTDNGGSESEPKEPDSSGNGHAEPEVEVAAPTSDDPVATLKDQLLRLAADFDNYRKRARREIEDVRKHGIEALLNDVLPVLDNLERALAHSEGDKSPVLQGVRMVQKQFVDILSRYGVTTFQSVGQPFDPEKHEAVGQTASKDQAPGTIVSEAQRGYQLHGRLLRPARVVVASQGEQDQASQPD
jgi:molecular chaperone GrpE